jgi:uncharacterized membrane protein
MTKTLSFAAMHFTVAFGVVYALTGDLVIGGAVALIEPAVNTIAYHFHEKVWERLRHRAPHAMRRRPTANADRGFDPGANAVPC